MKSHLVRLLFFPILIFINLSCSTTHHFANRYSEADKIASDNNFRREYIRTDNFTLTSYYHLKTPGEPLTVYIEGDGVAWETKRRVSKDPTPRKALVLSLAVKDRSSNIVYIARPGQYSEALCDSKYWSSERFSEKVIDSINQVVDYYKKLSGSDRINLIGYSGGGAVAVLVASKRKDIENITTIAGNLDTDSVNEYHGVSLLKDSLNPIDVAPLIKNIPQKHFIGKKDKVIPSFIVQNFLKIQGNPKTAKIIVLEDATHEKGWLERWPEHK